MAHMNFEEVYQKYRAGTASKEEIEYIEKEVQKAELIQEYLMEEMDQQLAEDTYLQSTQSRAKEVQTIRKSMKRKIQKIILSAVGASVAIMITIFLIISPLMNIIYYKPDDEFNLLYSIQSELHNPYEHIIVYGKQPKSLGFGAYEFPVQKTNPFTLKSTMQTVTFKRNEVRTTDIFPTMFLHHYGDKLVGSGMEQDYRQSEDERDELIKELRKLPSTTEVSTVITFKSELSAKDFLNLISTQRESLTYTWAGVRHVEEDRQEFIKVGFYPEASRILYDEPPFDINKYPSLTAQRNETPAQLEERFKNMLQYMDDHHEFQNTFSLTDDPLYYKNALIYIEEHGIRIYAVHVNGNIENMIELIQDENTNSVVLLDVLLTKYMKGN